MCHDVGTPAKAVTAVVGARSTDGGCNRENSPQVYCIFLFLCAACLFGTLISQVNEIVASQGLMSKELDSVLESYLILQPR